MEGAKRQRPQIHLILSTPRDRLAKLTWLNYWATGARIIWLPVSFSHSDHWSVAVARFTFSFLTQFLLCLRARWFHGIHLFVITTAAVVSCRANVNNSPWWIDVGVRTGKKSRDSAKRPLKKQNWPRKSNQYKSLRAHYGTTHIKRWMIHWLACQ